MVMMEVPEDLGKFSDGYHTFDELYDHRCLLFLSLLKCIASSGDYSQYYPWYSLKHSDDSVWDGWFITGIHKNDLNKSEQISYHIPVKFLELADKTGAWFVDNAPEWDGHTSEDVLVRLSNLIQSKL